MMQLFDATDNRVRIHMLQFFRCCATKCCNATLWPWNSAEGGKEAFAFKEERNWQNGEYNPSQGIGRQSENVVPFPISLSTWTLPWWFWMMP